MSRLFIDCEFNGMGGGLISLALASEDGDREFYEVVECHEDIEPWVRDNVMPILGKTALKKEEFQKRLSTFLKQFPTVHVVADFPDDIKHLMEIMLTGPGEWFMIQPMTMEIDDQLSAKKSKIKHNALEDARALRWSYFKNQGMVE